MPVERHGVKLMSLGLFFDEDAPLVVRGPIMHNTVRPLPEEVAWGEPDYLIVELPPAPGDVPLTVAPPVPGRATSRVPAPQLGGAPQAGRAG